MKKRTRITIDIIEHEGEDSHIVTMTSFHDDGSQNTQPVMLGYDDFMPAEAEILLSKVFRDILQRFGNPVGEPRQKNKA